MLAGQCMLPVCVILRSRSFANNWWRERKARKQAEKLTEEDDTELLGLSPKTDHQWEQDFKLDADEGLFGEYLEMGKFVL